MRWNCMPLYHIIHFFLLFILILQTRLSTLFPYTTLFRSGCRFPGGTSSIGSFGALGVASLVVTRTHGTDISAIIIKRRQNLAVRSEEHTSELQSRENLVCRLLLEKKKNIKDTLTDDE